MLSVERSFYIGQEVIVFNVILIPFVSTTFSTNILIHLERYQYGCLKWFPGQENCIIFIEKKSY